MAVLVQRLATTDCQVMMAGVTTTMTMERNPFLEMKVILDLDQFGSCVCLPTHLRCSAIISLMHPPSGPFSLHYFCSVASSFDLEIFFLPLSTIVRTWHARIHLLYFVSLHLISWVFISQPQHPLVQSISRSPPLAVLGQLSRSGRGSRSMIRSSRWNPQPPSCRSFQRIVDGILTASLLCFADEKNTGLDDCGCRNRGIMIQNVKIQCGCVEKKKKARQRIRWPVKCK